jgi:hypothetical protein
LDGCMKSCNFQRQYRRLCVLPLRRSAPAAERSRWQLRQMPGRGLLGRFALPAGMAVSVGRAAASSRLESTEIKRGVGVTSLRSPTKYRW